MSQQLNKENALLSKGHRNKGEKEQLFQLLKHLHLNNKEGLSKLKASPFFLFNFFFFFIIVSYNEVLLTIIFSQLFLHSGVNSTWYNKM